MLAARLEGVEARAWADLVAAAPARHAAQIGLDARWIGGALVLRCPGGGFDRGLFNRPIGLGVLAPVTPAAVEQILAGYRAAGSRRHMLVHQPECAPADYSAWIEAAGLRPGGAWDRVFRDAGPLNDGGPGPARPIAVAEVRAGDVEEWSEFLAAVYRVQAAPWLRALFGRAGWHHYVAREGGRVVGARSMYLAGRGEPAFLAIDGPVPGVMTDDHIPDEAICRRIVEDGLRRGAGAFVADIEAPSPSRAGPAYRAFGRLGFRVPYTRTHHTAA